MSCYGVSLNNGIYNHGRQKIKKIDYPLLRVITLHALPSTIDVASDRRAAASLIALNLPIGLTGRGGGGGRGGEAESTGWMKLSDRKRTGNWEEGRWRNRKPQ
jgi:hypothetical protein